MFLFNSPWIIWHLSFCAIYHQMLSRHNPRNTRTKHPWSDNFKTIYQNNLFLFFIKKQFHYIFPSFSILMLSQKSLTPYHPPTPCSPTHPVLLPGPGLIFNSQYEDKGIAHYLYISVYKTPVMYFYFSKNICDWKFQPVWHILAVSTLRKLRDIGLELVPTCVT